MLALNLITLYGVGFLVWRNVEKDPTPLAVTSQPTVTHTYDCNLTRVIDANTLEVDIDLGFDTWLKSHRFELLDVDLRNVKSNRNKDLTAELKRLLTGRKLTIQSVQNRKGAFNRWLARIYADGQCINDQMQSLLMLDE